MMLTHGANSLQLGVEIGGRTYRTVKIGYQRWMAENLDYKFNGCAIGAAGTPNTPAGWYYNNDEQTYGVNGNKYGLLYNWHAVEYLNNHLTQLGIPEGWHVATYAEWGTLATTAGGDAIAGTRLKSTTGWSSGNGTDNFGFSAFPSGYRNADFDFVNLDINANFWTATEYSSTEAYYRYFVTRADMGSFYVGKAEIAFSVRLVNDD